MSVEKTEEISKEVVANMQGFTGGDFSVEDIVHRVNNKQWKAFYIVNDKERIGIIVYIVRNAVAYIFAATGKHITTEQHWVEVKEFFRNEGATKIEAAMRDSTLRLWQRLGFSKKYNVAEVFI